MLPTHWKQEEEEEGKANHRQTLNPLTPLQIAASSSCFLGPSCPFTASANNQATPSLPGQASLPKENKCSHQTYAHSAQSTFPSTSVLPHCSCPSSRRKPPPTSPAPHTSELTAYTAPTAALQLPWLRPGLAREPVGQKRFLGVTSAGNLHRHLRVTAGAKDTL